MTGPVPLSLRVRSSHGQAGTGAGEWPLLSLGGGLAAKEAKPAGHSWTGGHGLTSRRLAGLAILGATLLGGRARAGSDERPALPALLEGDPALVAIVADDLGRRGVATAAAGDGAAIRVTLAQEPGDILLGLRDQQGRAAERRVATAETAAALIESWARPGIAQPLLDRQAPPPPVAPAAAILGAPPAGETGARWTPMLRLGAETGGVHGLWLGAAVGGCGRLGPLCLGGEARIAHQLDRAHDPDPRFESLPAESDMQALLLVEWPISLGRPVLVLGAGAGLGWRHGGDDGRLGIRQELRATVALPLWSRLAIEVGATAGVGPQAAEEGRPEERWAPRGQLRFGLGLRWGLP